MPPKIERRMQDSAKTQRLGRSALLVQGLGLLAAGVVAAAMYFLGMESGESTAIIAVASAAAGVFLFWSLLLAVRAITGGERGRWPMVVVLLALLEIGLPCLRLWSEVLEDHHNAALNFMIWLGLPVFGPFIAIGSLLAAPLALWRARKVEAAESAAGVKSWRRRTWKVWLAWYAGVMAGLGIFLLPGPLFLLGNAAQFYTTEVGDEDYFNRGDGWAAYLAMITPDIVRDSMESLVHFVPSSAPNKILERIYFQGNVSMLRLIERSEQTGLTQGMHEYIGQGLDNSHPGWEDWLVIEIRTGKRKAANAYERKLVLEWIARRGKASELRELLKSFAASSLENRWILEQMHINENLSEVLYDLETFAFSSWPSRKEREVALELTTAKLSNDELIALWKRCFASGEKDVHFAIAAVSCRAVMHGAIEPMLIVLRASDSEIRRAVMIPLVQYRDGLKPHLFRNPKNAEHLQLTRRLYEMLDDPDTALSLAAMCVLGDIFCEGDGDAYRNKISERICSLQLRPEVMPVLDEEDRAGIAQVKAAVGKWLKENAVEKTD